MLADSTFADWLWGCICFGIPSLIFSFFFLGFAVAFGVRHGMRRAREDERGGR